MTIKNEDLVPMANKIITYYATDGAAIAAFDEDFGAAFLAALILKRNQVAALDDPKGKTDNMKMDTLTCDGFMDLMGEQMVVLKYKLTKCHNNGSIPDSVESFFCSEITNAGLLHNFERFSFYCLLMIAKVDIAANTDALEAVNYTAIEIGNLLATYTNAKNANTGFMNTETDRVNLVPANRGVRKELSAMLSGLVGAANACFSSPLNKAKKKLWVQAAILRTIRPTPPIVPKDKHFTAMQRRCLYRKLALRWLLEMTFNKGEGVMTVGRAMSVDGTPSATEVLPFGVKVTKKLNDIAGTGKFLIFTFTGTGKGSVRTFIIKP